MIVSMKERYLNFVSRTEFSFCLHGDVCWLCMFMEEPVNRQISDTSPRKESVESPKIHDDVWCRYTNDNIIQSLYDEIPVKYFKTYYICYANRDHNKGLTIYVTIF